MKTTNMPKNMNPTEEDVIIIMHIAQRAVRDLKKI